MPDILEQFAHRDRFSTVGMVFAIDEFLTVGGLDPLVVELQTGQLDAHQRQEAGAEQRPDDRRPDQRMGNIADDRQRADLLGKGEQDGQEGDEGHDGFHEADAQLFQRGGKAHRIFLHTLGRTLDMAQFRPMAHVIIVHRRAPAEDIMADEEEVQHANGDGEESNACKIGQPPVEFRSRDRAGRRQPLLHHIVERAIPSIDCHTHLNVEIGGEQNEGRTED